MGFLVIGLLGLFLKDLDIAPVAHWPWWVVLAPFALAIVWWAWADSSGYTKRKVVERENRRKQVRIDRQREGMGLAPRRKKP